MNKVPPKPGGSANTYISFRFVNETVGKYPMYDEMRFRILRVTLRRKLRQGMIKGT